MKHETTTKMDRVMKSWQIALMVVFFAVVAAVFPILQAWNEVPILAGDVRHVDEDQSKQTFGVESPADPIDVHKPTQTYAFVIHNRGQVTAQDFHGFFRVHHLGDGTLPTFSDHESDAQNSAELVPNEGTLLNPQTIPTSQLLQAGWKTYLTADIWYTAKFHRTWERHFCYEFMPNGNFSTAETDCSRRPNHR